MCECAGAFYLGVCALSHTWLSDYIDFVYVTRDHPLVSFSLLMLFSSLSLFLHCVSFFYFSMIYPTFFNISFLVKDLIQTQMTFSAQFLVLVLKIISFVI